MLLGVILIISPVAVISSETVDSIFAALLNAKSLKCTLGPGAVGDWESGDVKVAKQKWDSTMHFDSINPKAGTARLIGNAGSTDVAVIVTPAGFTFIEQTGAGNLVFTTVFASYKKNTNEFQVVSSRHIAMMGSPLPSQYHGTCKVWE